MNMDHVRLQMDRVALHITHTLVSVCGCVCVIRGRPMPGSRGSLPVISVLGRWCSGGGGEAGDLKQGPLD